ncbi:hypothetical protein MRB53_039469 [Persea americana]|nr:hypothetical protein MRB53_039469 [Persea americana]
MKSLASITLHSVGQASVLRSPKVGDYTTQPAASCGLVWYTRSKKLRAGYRRFLPDSSNCDDLVYDILIALKGRNLTPGEIIVALLIFFKPPVAGWQNTVEVFEPHLPAQMDALEGRPMCQALSSQDSSELTFRARARDLEAFDRNYVIRAGRGCAPWLSRRVFASPEWAGGAASIAEVALLPALKHCLVNLPISLVTTLLNSNTLLQNVIVELTFRPPPSSGAEPRGRAAAEARSVYLGWTGMQSQTKLSPLTGRDSIRSSGGRQDQDVAVVELDAAFGRRLGLHEGMKVG